MERAKKNEKKKTATSPNSNYNHLLVNLLPSEICDDSNEQTSGSHNNHSQSNNGNLDRENLFQHKNLNELNMQVFSNVHDSVENSFQRTTSFPPYHNQLMDSLQIPSNNSFQYLKCYSDPSYDTRNFKNNLNLNNSDNTSINFNVDHPPTNQLNLVNSKFFSDFRLQSSRLNDLSLRNKYFNANQHNDTE